VLYMGTVFCDSDRESTSMFHFHMRQPAEVSSGVPNVALQCLHRTKASCV
jgi:hypothetical protein